MSDAQHDNSPHDLLRWYRAEDKTASSTEKSAGDQAREFNERREVAQRGADFLRGNIHAYGEILEEIRRLILNHNILQDEATFASLLELHTKTYQLSDTALTLLVSKKREGAI